VKNICLNVGILFLIVFSALIDLKSAQAVVKDYFFESNNLNSISDSLTDEESKFLTTLKKFLVSRQGESTWRSYGHSSDFSFHPKWQVQNGIPYIENIQGSLGKDNYQINLVNKLTYSVENTDKANQLSRLRGLFERIHRETRYNRVLIWHPRRGKPKSINYDTFVLKKDGDNVVTFWTENGLVKKKTLKQEAASWIFEMLPNTYAKETIVDWNGHTGFPSVETLTLKCGLTPKLSDIHPPTTEKLSIDVKPFSEGQVWKSPEIDDIRARLWKAIFEQHGGTVPGLKIDWIFDSQKLILTRASGDLAGQKFSLEFQFGSKAFFKLTLKDDSRKDIFGFSGSSDYGNFSKPGHKYLFPSGSYYDENAQLSVIKHDGWTEVLNRQFVMDDDHLKIVVQFMEKLIRHIQEI
jgi:hypothetical protein